MNENGATPLPLLIVRSLRVKQWTKNLVVFAAFVFALGVGDEALGPASLVRVCKAALLFCLLSSGIYLMNDVKDLSQDRMHPIKKRRPVASGQVSAGTALTASALLLLLGLTAAWFLSRPFFSVATGYVVMQVAYCFGLKRVPLVDVFVIATGFVLRALAGAVAIAVPISPWLLLCAMLLALFLALCKRRHEKVVEEDFAKDTRPTLQQYDEKLLDQLIAIVSAATIVCYALYTLWPDTVEKFGTPNLGFTIPFVLLGLFRYLDLVYRHEKGGRPEHILLTDLPLLFILAMYGLCVLLVLFVF